MAGAKSTALGPAASLSVVADVKEVAEAAGPYGIAGAILVAAIKLGPIARQIYDVLVAIWEQREIDREQQRRRDLKRRRIESTQPPNRPQQHSKMPSVDLARRSDDAVPDFVREENTDVVVVTEDVQKRRPGLRKPRPGTHHDRSNGED
jgi:hypothetical protein